MAIPPRSSKRVVLALVAACVYPMLTSTAMAQTGVQQLPVLVADETIVGEGDIQVYTVDFANVPTRPALRITVEPDAAHPDLETEVLVTNWQGTYNGPGFGCPSGPSAVRPIPVVPMVGTSVTDVNLFECEPRIDGIGAGFWPGKTADVQIRVTDFGGAGPPADVDIEIRGITKVPTRSSTFVVDTNLSLRTTTLSASFSTKDTVLYQTNTTTSNGDGSFLWSGTDYRIIPIIGGGFIPIWRELRSLIAFPTIVSQVPFNAQIFDASLVLFSLEARNGGGAVRLFEVAEDPSGQTWAEGNADASGDEFVGTTSSTTAADWGDRRGTSIPWSSPGGDVVGLQLAEETVTSASVFVEFTSLALENAIQGMIDRQDAREGFQLRGPSTSLTQDRAVRFASLDNSNFSLRPELELVWFPNEPFSEGSFNPGVVSFIGEGDDFRWVNDFDADDVVTTTNGGVCDATEPDAVNNVPYTYAFTGSPSYSGIECCTWRVDSPQTGTVGSGQALFYHNLDPITAPVPTDIDGDGIVDLCDNCPSVPNGPALGTCVGPLGAYGTCLADGDCWTGFSCQFAQDDGDQNFVGDACQVPEPGTGLGLVIGSLALAALGGRRSRWEEGQ